MLHLSYIKSRTSENADNCLFNKGCNLERNGNDFMQTTSATETGSTSNADVFPKHHGVKPNSSSSRPTFALQSPSSTFGTPFTAALEASCMQLPQSWMTSLCESEDNIWSNRNKPDFTAPPIAIPLLEMGFTLKHILKAISETKSSGEFTSHTVNMLATWMLEHPSLDISEDEGTSARYNLFRFLDRSQNLLRQQSLDNTEIKCGHRRGIGLRGTICSELRNTIGQVDRVLQDTVRERQHVRGEGHHLLRNFSCEGSSSDINLLESNDTDQREQIPSTYIGIENNI